MGREIVYCEGCGNSLREGDFERGRGRMIDNRPYCTECRPFAEGEAERSPRRTPSGKIAAPPPRKSGTGSVPIVSPPRRPAPAAATNPLPILAGAGGVVFIVLIFAVTQGGSRRAPAPTTEPALAPPIEIPTRRPPPAEPPPRDPPPRDPPPPPPTTKRDPPPASSKPSEPLAAPSAAEKFESFLQQIRQRIRDDVRKEQTEEILRMLSFAVRTAGARVEEVEKLRAEYLETLDEATRQAAIWTDWHVTSSTEPGATGLLPSYGDRKNVYMTHPLAQGVPATIDRQVEVPTGKKTTLSFWVSCHQKGDFELRVSADGKSLLKEIVGPPGSGWRQKTVDLTTFAGKKIALRLENFPNNWEWEQAYWSDLKITSENY
jgi:hypothetical protein